MADLDREPIAAVITRHLGPARSRAGVRSDRPWWQCCFHEDRNPSLTTVPGAERFKCFGCGAAGDAIDFVRRLNPSMTFQEARAAIGQRTPVERTARPRQRARSPSPTPKPEVWQQFARTIVERAEAALWSGRGDGARAELHDRGLTDDAIRDARLGLHAHETYAVGIFPDARVWVPRGITIPWFDGGEVTMVNIRRPRGRDPKYWAVRGSRRGGIYPSGGVIAIGRPVVIVEGEFEAILLNQELAGLAPAITLGSAGDRPTTDVLSAMLSGHPWFVAGDSDQAGEKAARDWAARSGRCRRVKPPAPWKDWTEARRGGLNLREFWADTLRQAVQSP